MNDILGIPIKVGDKVAYFGTHDVNRVETVESFTSQKVRITDSYYVDKSMAVSPNKLLLITDQMRANTENYPELFL